MSAETRVLMREVFEVMSETVQPPIDLGHRVQVAARLHRRSVLRRLITGAAGALLIAAAIVTAVHLTGTGRVSPSARQVVLNIPVNAAAGEAVGSKFLYVATGDAPNSALSAYTLSAYNRTTGKLIRTISVPALVVSLNVGPGGMVWITYYPDQNYGGTGLWLLNADLSKRSSAGRIAYEIGLSALLPTSPTTALVSGPGGIDELRLAAPGQPGVATLRRISSLRTDHQFGGMVGVAPLHGGTAVLQGRDTGGSRIVLAGIGTEYEPRDLDIVSMLGQAGGLWVATGPRSMGGPDGSLVRLGPRLQVQTPRVIANYPAFRFVFGLLVHGDTVWVSTAAAQTPQLYCFRFVLGKGAGPITFVPTRPPRSAVAATASTVYVADATSITSLPVPSACR